jgi:peptidyl-prolyl cis-trans isomerase SurA
MNRKIRTACIILLLLAFVSLAFAGELVDKIAAVIGDEIILVSEIDFQLQMLAMQMNMKEISPSQVDSLRALILQQMVSDKLILVEAMKDTSIQVTDDQIETALSEKMNELKSRFSTDAEFEAQMKLEGLTLRELKAKFRREVRNQLIRDRFISHFLTKVTVTSAEVRDFYQRYEDSLPAQPDAVKLAHLLLEVKASENTLDSAYLRALEVKKLLDEGGDFIALAQIYSDDGTASSGGDLGYVDRGTLFKEFEEPVFAMQKGQISEPFKTRLGYHIVKLEDKLPDRIHARHILFRTNPSENDSRSAIALADSLRRLVVDSSADFVELVKEFSIDDESKKQGGELGWFAVEKLTPEFKTAIAGLKVGDISEPTESEFGIHLIKILDLQEARNMSLEKDWDRIKDFARREKSDRVMNAWLEKVKQNIYVDIRL